MNRTELADRLHRRRPELCKETAVEYVQDVFDIIAEALVSRERVKLKGIGMLVIKTLAEREGRDPRTGNKMHVPSKDTVRFRITRSFKAQLNGEE